MNYISAVFEYAYLFYLHYILIRRANIEFVCYVINKIEARAIWYLTSNVNLYIGVRKPIDFSWTFF